MSTEQTIHAVEGRSASTCPACGSPVAPDQRYCLECGERQMPRSALLLQAEAAQAPPSQSAPVAQAAPEDPRRNTLLVLGLVALLLIATGVGVLIGKSGRGPVYKPVIVNAGGGGTSAQTSSEGTSFTGDWPAAKTGFTVQLQTLPGSSSTQAVEAAKSAASAKGAKGVGALKAEEFSSLGGSEIVIYSGQYSSKSEAQKALGSLKSKFPGAKVIEVSSKEPGETQQEARESQKAAEAEKKKPAGQSILHPAKAPEKQSSGGKNYVEESKNLPNVLETGG